MRGNNNTTCKNSIKSIVPIKNIKTAQCATSKQLHRDIRNNKETRYRKHSHVSTSYPKSCRSDKH